MLHVTIDNGNVRERTGTGAYAAGVLSALREHASSVVEVREADISRGVPYFRPLFRVQYLWRLRKLVQQGFRGADVVHFMNVYVPPAHPVVAYVVTLHDLDAIEHPELYSQRYVLYYKRALDNAAQRATYVITDTWAVQTTILDRYRSLEGRVVPAGIGLLPAFTKAVDRIPRSIPVLPTILFVGSLTRKKNIRWMIDSIAAGVMSGALPRIKLVIAGSPSVGFPEIQAAMRRAGDIVEWVQNPGLERMAQLFRQSSALILPSRCEGFGIPLLEAMYCGLPIVASRIPTSVEVAGDIAEFFALDDKDEFYGAILEALQDAHPDTRRTKSVQRLKTYSWENLVPIFVSTYEAAVSRTSEKEVKKG